MKKIFISFLVVFFLFCFVSCNNNPASSGQTQSKAVAQRDENGHLTQIDYYKNGSIYKTEYYEYLNSHHDESKLMKTVENGEVTYEIEECWKLAYCLEQNTYKYDGDLYLLYPNKREYFSEINLNNKTIEYIRVSDEVETYNIITQTSSRGGRTGYSDMLKLIFLDKNKYEVVWNDSTRETDGNKRIFIKVD